MARDRGGGSGRECPPRSRVEQGTYDEQRTNAGAMAVSICAMLDAGWRVVVVHGNGPQVGNLAIQQEIGPHRGPGDAVVQPGGDDRGTAGVADRDCSVRRVRTPAPRSLPC